MKKETKNYIMLAIGIILIIGLAYLHITYLPQTKFKNSKTIRVKTGEEVIKLKFKE